MYISHVENQSKGTDLKKYEASKAASYRIWICTNEWKKDIDLKRKIFQRESSGTCVFHETWTKVQEKKHCQSSSISKYVGNYQTVQSHEVQFLIYGHFKKEKLHDNIANKHK